MIRSGQRAETRVSGWRAHVVMRPDAISIGEILIAD